MMSDGDGKNSDCTFALPHVFVKPLLPYKSTVASITSPWGAVRVHTASNMPVGALPVASADENGVEHRPLAVGKQYLVRRDTGPAREHLCHSNRQDSCFVRLSNDSR